MKKIHFVINGSSKTGICGLRHSNLITTVQEVFFKHSNKCDKCLITLNKLFKNFSKVETSSPVKE